MRIKDYHLLRITAVVLNIIFVTAVGVALGNKGLSRSVVTSPALILLSVITPLFTLLAMFSSKPDAHDDSYLKGIVVKAKSIRENIYRAFKNTLLETKAIHGILALPFVFFPIHTGISLSGIWYDIGFPIPWEYIRLRTESDYHLLGLFFGLLIWTLILCRSDLAIRKYRSKRKYKAEVVKFLLGAGYFCFVVAFTICTNALWDQFIEIHKWNELHSIQPSAAECSPASGAQR